MDKIQVSEECDANFKTKGGAEYLNQVGNSPDSEISNGRGDIPSRKRKRTRRASLHHNIRRVAPINTFCQNSSIRGVPKLIKHSYLGLRFLWVIFILSMLCLLVYGSISLIVEYMSYNTLINTREGHSTIAEFPSITICNHHPFKHSAATSFEKGEVLSPREFSENIRKAIKQTLKSNNLNEAKDLFNNDKLSSYFETIGPEKAGKIGHESSSVIYCILALKNGIEVGHNSECGLHYTVFQHPKFFNCHTLSINSDFTNKTVTLGLIVEIGGEPDYSNWEMGLVQDVFSQAHGTRITLHEPKTYPDPVRHGINLEAGKFIEMKFETNKYLKKSSPKEECIHPEMLAMDSRRTYRISNTDFDYTYELCQQQEFANKVLKECSCYTSLNPLSDNVMANSMHPYCSAINVSDIPGTIERLHCFREESLKRDNRSLTKDSDKETSCLRRCEYYTYDVHSSTSRWVSSDWQLFWLMTVSDIWKAIDQSKSDPNSQDYRDHIKELDQFLEAKNLTIPDSMKMKKLDTKRNVFFVVTRSSFITTEKVETLSLTSSALLSRIGGLSSLTLGVTFATFFEVIEFIFLCYHSFKKCSLEKAGNPLNVHTAA